MNPRFRYQTEELICDMLNGAEIEGLDKATSANLYSIDTAVIEEVSRTLPDWDRRGKVRRWLAWREFERRKALLSTVDITLHGSFEDVFDKLVAAKFVVEACWEDHGIGGYEYGGMRGVHHNWSIEPRVEGPDLLLIEACLDDYAPPEEAVTRHNFTVHVPPRSRRGEEETVEIEIAFFLKSVAMEHDTVTVEGEQLAFWRIRAELSTGEVSVS